MKLFFFTFLQNPLYFHINVHEAKKDYKCEPGPSLSNFLDELNEQNDFGAVRLENGNWQCPICSYSHKRKVYVTKHIKTEHLGTKLDSGKKFFTFFKKIYIFSITGVLDFNCEECGKAFALKGNLKKHMKVHEGGKTRPEDYIWENCGKEFAKKEYLKKHMRVHEGK